MTYLDSSFSLLKARSIYYSAKRAGIDLARAFFPDVYQLSHEIRQERSNLQQEHPLLVARTEKTVSDPHRATLNALESQRNNLLEAHLLRIVETINSKSFAVSCTSYYDRNEKLHYRLLPDDAASFFVLKHINSSLCTHFNIRFSSRNQIISAFSQFLDADFNATLLRLDIDDCYESIDFQQQIATLAANRALTPLHIRHLLQLSDEVSRLGKGYSGLPRGLAISAVLSEHKLINLDASIRMNYKPLFYARYADDILLAYSQQPSNDIHALASTMGIAFNTNHLKAATLQLSPSHLTEVTFLGYTFYRYPKKPSGLINMHPEANRFYRSAAPQTRVIVDMSLKRMYRYVARIESCIQAYYRDVSQNSDQLNGDFHSRRLLVRRLQYVSGNIKNQKYNNNLLLGVFSNNQYITTNASLCFLDRFMWSQLKALGFDRLYLRKMRLSFLNGFYKRRVFNYRTVHRLRRVMEVLSRV